MHSEGVTVMNTKWRAGRKESAFRSAMRRLRKNKAATTGLYIFLVLVVLAILAPWISKYPYDKMDMTNMLASPSLEHLFGTDDLGRDILSRILYGGRFSLSIGICAVGVAIVPSLFIGAISGYFGGRVDNIIMRCLDIIQSIPGILLTIAISTALGSGFDKTVMAIGIGHIPGFARILRASIMKIRGTEFLEASSAIGCKKGRIILKHVLPNSIAPLIVQTTMTVANSILTAASLSYVGLGVQPPTPEWGAMLSAGRTYIRNYPYLVIFPGLFIAVTVLALNMFGDGIRDVLDPKLKK